MSGELTKEIVPELKEYYCVSCLEHFFIGDVVREQYREVTITMRLLKPVADDNGIEWGVLCFGRDENEFSKEAKPHLAKYEVTRHKIVAAIPSEVILQTIATAEGITTATNTPITISLTPAIISHPS